MNKQQKSSFGKKLICAVIATSFACQAWAVNFTASVNSNQVGINQPFQLTLASDEIGADAPNLSPLQKDFTVLGTSQSTQVQIINGVANQSKKWIITLSPKQVGKVNIPSISMGGTSTQPIAMNVVQSNTKPQGQAQQRQPIQQAQQQAPQSKISITANVEKTNHYQFQEIPLTVRIETNAPLQQAELIAPTSADVELSQVGEDKSTQTIKDGHPISVLERQYLLRPQKTGKITLPPFTLQGYLQGNEPLFAEFQGFDDFLSSQFDGMMSRGKPFRIQSKPLTLSIKPSTNSKSGEWFLPAKSVQLKAEWQTPNPIFKIGEAVTRKIDLIALGATAEQLPKLTLANADGVKFYIDSDKTASKDTPQGTQALRELSVSVVPTQGGKVTLPKMEVKWLNTQTNKQETAILPAETINVQGGAKNTSQNNKLPTTATQNNITNSNENQATASDKAIAKENGFSVIDWLIFAMFIGLLVVIAIIVKQKRTSSKNTQIQTNNLQQEKNQTTDYLANVENGLKAKNAQQLYQALLQWQSGGMAFSEELKQYFQQLEQFCYQPNSETKFYWQGIKQAIQKQKFVKKQATQTDDKKLPPLYR